MNPVPCDIFIDLQEIFGYILSLVPTLSRLE